MKLWVVSTNSIRLQTVRQYKRLKMKYEQDFINFPPQIAQDFSQLMQK